MRVLPTLLSKLSPFTAALVLLPTLTVLSPACSNDDGNGSDAAPSPNVAEIHEDQPTEDGGTPAVPGSTTAKVNEFLKSDVAHLQTARHDSAKTLLVNTQGDVAIVGVTRSKVVREPGLGGDILFTRYRIAGAGKGWDAKPVQIPVVVPPLPPPTDPNAVVEERQPLATPLVDVKGGRLLDSGKVLVIGEMSATSFPSAQMFLEETKAAAQTIFLAVFGPDNGMTKSARYGLTGANTVIGTTSSAKQATVLVAGETETGLRLNSTTLTTQTTTRSNYIAEISDDGDIVRHISWPTAVGGVNDHIGAISSNSAYVITASQRAGKQIYVRSFRQPGGSTTFLTLPEKQVCADATLHATSANVTSIDATETEVVVAIEIVNADAAPGQAFPCFEVFDIRPQGTLVPKREVVYLSTVSTTAGTTRATFVPDNRILISRTRSVADTLGIAQGIVTFLYERPLTADGYEGRSWALDRPSDWYGNDSVDGLQRNLVQVVWPKSSAQKDVVWILANDETLKTDPKAATESIIHLGNYTAIPGVK